LSPRHRIDWVAAKIAFVSDPTRSFGKIARQFGVSDVAVGKHARAEGWQAEAEAFEKIAGERALARAHKTREERVAQALRIVDGLLDEFEATLPQKAEDAKASDLPGIVKLAELLAGEATERVDPGQVQQVLAIVLRLGAQGLPREAFLEQFDRAVAGVLEAPAGTELVT
jgi:hypothetical protein